MAKKVRKILSDRDKYTLLKNRKICTDSNGMHCFDENALKREGMKSG